MELTLFFGLLAPGNFLRILVNFLVRGKSPHTRSGILIDVRIIRCLLMDMTKKKVVYLDLELRGAFGTNNFVN